MKRRSKVEQQYRAAYRLKRMSVNISDENLITLRATISFVNRDFKFTTLRPHLWDGLTNHPAQARYIRRHIRDFYALYPPGRRYPR